MDLQSGSARNQVGAVLFAEDQLAPIQISRQCYFLLTVVSLSIINKIILLS